MWSNALGKPVEHQEQIIIQVFKSFAGNKKYFDAEDYCSKMQADPALMDWFSKPASALNRELGKKVMKKDECISKDTLIEQQELIQNFLKEIQELISKAVNSLKGKELKRA